MRSTFLLVLINTFVFLGCTSSFTGQYADPDEVEILDDRWNETDARKTAQHLVKSMMSKHWLSEYTATHKAKKPIMVVAEIENRTDEHIETEALSEYVVDELLNSGRVRFVNAKAREKINKELSYQHESGLVDPNKMVAIGKQIGAQFLVMGAISSQVHTQNKLKSVTYQTALTLTNIETSEIEWSEKYLVKKKFKRSNARW